MRQIAYTVESVVRTTGLSRSRIIRAIRAGNLEAKKAGRKIVIEGDALQSYLAALPPASKQAA